ncbi:hypothetical protein C9994_01115 [Marivirga lumbricoides]|uniref:Lipoprotein n=1 Tax=Marivirga lumbricoides TaxID=1046115 RepID=A0A2T4DVL8_9BACT|nr:hypothetical protein C9994_01115 [Marivirga lumbricoides]
MNLNKTKMKRLIYSLMMVSLVSQGCTEDQIDLTPSLSSELKINFTKWNEISQKESFNRKSDKLKFLKNSDVLVNPANSNLRTEEIESILIETSEINNKNLNAILSLSSNSTSILAITLLEKGNKNPDGMIIHYLDNEEKLKFKSLPKKR